MGSPHPLRGWRALSDLAGDVAFEARITLASLAGGRSDAMRPTQALHPRLRIVWPRTYQWALASKWCDPVLAALGQHAPSAREDIAQPYERIVVFHALADGRRVPLALDYADYHDNIDDDCLRKVRLYFKMQFSRAGYPDPRIVPGQYVASQDRIQALLPTLRRIADRPKRFDVWGRFGARYAREIRARAIALLSTQRRFGFEGGLEIVRYTRALRQMAASRVCVDLPGNGPLCFRLIEYLAIGTCIVAPRHRAVLSPALEDGVHIAYCADDLSDMVEICEHYLRHPQARERMAANARAFYDRHLAPAPLGRYYLQKVEEALA